MIKTDDNGVAATTTAALIGNDISYIKKDIAEIKVSIKEIAGVYVSMVTFNDASKAIQLRILNLENSSNLWIWMSPAMAAVFGSILTFLLIQYLMHSR